MCVSVECETRLIELICCDRISNISFSAPYFIFFFSSIDRMLEPYIGVRKQLSGISCVDDECG